MRLLRITERLGRSGCRWIRYGVEKNHKGPENTLPQVGDEHLKEQFVTNRQSISIDGLSHQTAIPVASKIGPLLTSSVIAPFNPDSRVVPKSIDAQYANIFRHTELMLKAAGGGWQHVAKMEFWLAQAADRPALEEFWLRYFPDAASRPARHTHVGQVQRMSAAFIAYIAD